MNDGKIDDDIYVRREDILKYFNPPPKRSTFYDWRDQGLVVPAGSSKVLKGYYKLNASLKRLGLPIQDIKAWRTENLKNEGNLRERSLIFTALAVLTEELMLCPADEFATGLNEKELNSLGKVYEAHRKYLDITVESFEEEGSVYPLKDIRERLAYAGGVLDAFDMEKHGHIRGG